MFTREVEPCRMQDAALLMDVNARARTAEVLAVANAYFNEYERLAILRDEIDFAAAAAEIPLDDSQFVRFEEPRGERLAHSASLGARRRRTFGCTRIA
jgi:hypothetical protein